MDHIQIKIAVVVLTIICIIMMYFAFIYDEKVLEGKSNCEPCASSPSDKCSGAHKSRVKKMLLSMRDNALRAGIMTTITTTEPQMILLTSLLWTGVSGIMTYLSEVFDWELDF